MKSKLLMVLTVSVVDLQLFQIVLEVIVSQDHVLQVRPEIPEVSVRTSHQHHVLLTLLDHLMESLAFNAYKGMSLTSIELHVYNRQQPLFLALLEKYNKAICALYVLIIREHKEETHIALLTIALATRFLEKMELVRHAVKVSSQVKTKDSA
jgi:hypothetical protein